ncbi:MAG: divalent cation tolerance protein CutA [Streptosporangiales bacterium]|nr:divalent cation tolerance protein CutA [Streptosporangiales bacterium]
MGDYISAIWGWDERAQRVFHDRLFTPGRWKIITVRGEDVGMLNVERRPEEIYLARIEVHPDHQGRGIGARLVRSLLDEAARDGKELALDVLDVNERAQALYRRLGLHEVARHGDDAIKVRMSTRPPVVQAQTVIDSREEADEIAEVVVRERLAACAQVWGPITSTYWWEGEVETAEEWAVVMKTPAAIYPELEARIRELHPYDVPDIVATRLAAGLPDYLTWVRTETRPPDGPDQG